MSIFGLQGGLECSAPPPLILISLAHLAYSRSSSPPPPRYARPLSPRFSTSGRIPPPQTGLGGSLHPHHSRTKGLRPLKKSISEAGGLGGYLEGASSARVSAIAAAEMSRVAVASALDSLLGCLEVQPSPRVQQPPLSPSYSFSHVRPVELSVWEGVYSTE